MKDAPTPTTLEGLLKQVVQRISKLERLPVGAVPTSPAAAAVATTDQIPPDAATGAPFFVVATGTVWEAPSTNTGLSLAAWIAAHP